MLWAFFVSCSQAANFIQSHLVVNSLHLHLWRRLCIVEHDNGTPISLSVLNFSRCCGVIFSSRKEFCSLAGLLLLQSFSWSLCYLSDRFGLFLPAEWWPPSLASTPLWTAYWDFPWTATKYIFNIWNQLQVLVSQACIKSSTLLPAHYWSKISAFSL